MIFGQKEFFAYEANSNNGYDGFLELWINNSKIGEKKRSGVYAQSLPYLKQVITTYKDLKNDKLKTFTPAEVASYVAADDLIWSGDPMLLNEAKARQKYKLFLGDQFDGLCSFIIIYESPNFRIIVWYYKKKGAIAYSDFAIEENKFLIATEEFIKWIEQNTTKRT